MTTKKPREATSERHSTPTAKSDDGQPPTEPSAGWRLSAESAAFPEGGLWERTFDAVPELIAIIDTQHRILRANKAMAERLGLTKEQCAGKACYSFVHGADEPPAMCPHSQLLKDGQEHAADICEKGLGGHFHVSVSPIRDSAGNLIGSVHIARDITEHKQAQEALLESEERFRLTFDQLPIGAAMVSLDFRYLRVNEALCRITGYPREELTNLGFPDITHPDDVAGDLERAQRVVTGEIDHYEMDKRYIRKDGEIAWIHLVVRLIRSAAGQPLYCLPTMRDITERKRIEDALKLANAYNRSLIEVSLDPLVTIGPDGKITDVNVATEEATGRSRKELIGTDFCSYFTDPEKARAGYQRVFRDGFVRDYALELRHRDEKVTFVLYNASVYRDDNGKAIGVFAAARDITDRKRAEESLRRSEKMQAEAEKLAATGRMAAQVAHEINNPLAGIKNSFRLIRDAVPKDHPDRDMVERIEREIDRIAHIVRQMYELHSPRAHAPRSIAVGQTIGDVIAMLEPLCREHEVAIELGPVPAELMAWLPEGSLQQIVYNLTVNAIQAYTHGGIVNIYVDDTDTEYVVISVRDRGCGIPLELQDRVFEPFVSAEHTEATKQGLGLGLSIVKSIVGSVGGMIEFESNINEGTCFHVYLRSKQP
jgi:PAS domain S-box-containing protein